MKTKQVDDKNSKYAKIASKMPEEINIANIRDRFQKFNPEPVQNEEEEELHSCLFYKNKPCKPNEVQFKICLKCHRCQALTLENVIPKLFNRIVSMAVLFVSVFGNDKGQAGEQAAGVEGMSGAAGSKGGGSIGGGGAGK